MSSIDNSHYSMIFTTLKIQRRERYPEQKKSNNRIEGSRNLFFIDVQPDR